jgi:CDP-glucose 4,6-dehydratase
LFESAQSHLSAESRFARSSDLRTAFNFGPELSSNKTVSEVVSEILRHWPGMWKDHPQSRAVHEAGKLHLATEKAFHLLGWRQVMSFAETIQTTVEWYLRSFKAQSPHASAELSREQIVRYVAQAAGRGLAWAN